MLNSFIIVSEPRLSRCGLTEANLLLGLAAGVLHQAVGRAANKLGGREAARDPMLAGGHREARIRGA